jgi:hydroxymethylpyrimidine pyrophosphatase-like HAD family hydrolase
MYERSWFSAQELDYIKNFSPISTHDVFASDLDRTMVYSLGSSGLKNNHPVLTVAEFHKEKPLSYVTDFSYRILDFLSDSLYFVPATTRSLGQFRRIILPPISRSLYAVTNNGGKILSNGVEDPDWTTYIKGYLEESSVHLDEVKNIIEEKYSRPWIHNMTFADDLFIVLHVDKANIPKSYVDDLTSWLTERGWKSSLQGSKLYCIPAALTKGAAVQEVCQRLNSSGLYSAGDSLLDRTLLSLADIAYRPAHGELDAVGYQQDNLIVTDTVGIMAGQEILARIVRNFI